MKGTKKLQERERDMKGHMRERTVDDVEGGGGQRGH